MFSVAAPGAGGEAVAEEAPHPALGIDVVEVDVGVPVQFEPDREGVPWAEAFPAQAKAEGQAWWSGFDHKPLGQGLAHGKRRHGQEGQIANRSTPIPCLTVTASNRTYTAAGSRVPGTPGCR